MSGMPDSRPQARSPYLPFPPKGKADQAVQSPSSRKRYWSINDATLSAPMRRYAPNTVSERGAGRNYYDDNASYSGRTHTKFKSSSQQDLQHGSKQGAHRIQLSKVKSQKLDQASTSEQSARTTYESPERRVESTSRTPLSALLTQRIVQESQGALTLERRDSDTKLVVKFGVDATPSMLRHYSVKDLKPQHCRHATDEACFGRASNDASKVEGCFQASKQYFGLNIAQISAVCDKGAGTGVAQNIASLKEHDSTQQFACVQRVPSLIIHHEPELSDSEKQNEAVCDKDNNDSQVTPLGGDEHLVKGLYCEAAANSKNASSELGAPTSVIESKITSHIPASLQNGGQPVACPLAQPVPSAVTSKARLQEESKDVAEVSAHEPQLPSPIPGPPQLTQHTPERSRWRHYRSPHLSLLISRSDRELAKATWLINFTRWKRAQGIHEHAKVFIVMGGYQDVREALLAKGWMENLTQHTDFFDFKWTLRTRHIHYSRLHESQVVNHFPNAFEHLTTKVGLLRSLRGVAWYARQRAEMFFPRCYNLSDPEDWECFQVIQSA